VHIGIDASCWANRRGYGRYTREIVTSILAADTRNAYTLFLDAETLARAPALRDLAPLVVIPTTAAAADAASSDGSRSVADLWAMSRAVATRRRNLDLFYFPSVYTYFPLPSGLTTLVTIHDTIAERHPHLVFPHWRNRLFWNLKVKWAVRRARLVLTVSQTSKAAIQEEFRLGPERIRIVPDAVSPAFAPAPAAPNAHDLFSARGLSPGSRFILYVGGISPHKNIETLVEAFCRLSSDGQAGGVTLVLAGDYQGDVFYSSYQSLQALLKARNAEARVVFTGFVPDDELPHWYRAAQCVVMPSLDEGFGLPALEAMACGTPVVASRAGALPEVIGDAGLLFDPRSAEALAAAMERLLSDDDLHRTLSSRGLARAGSFTWSASARAAIEVFQEIGSGQSQSE